MGKRRKFTRGFLSDSSIIILAAVLILTACSPHVVTRSQLAASQSAAGDESSGDRAFGGARPPSAKKTVTDGNEPVTLRIVDWSDSTKARRMAYNNRFMEEHPNVKVEYTTLTADQFKETVVSAIKAGNAPDLFPLPTGMKLSSAVSEGWYLPMSDYLGDGFLETFTEGSLNEGITSLNGNVYLLPESANIVNTLMFYNKTVLRKAGIQEDDLPRTWSQFLQTCCQVTKAGKGRFYGIIESGAQPNRMELALRSFASLDGARCGDIAQILLTDGKNTMDSPGMRHAFEFYDSLVREGAFHPDSTLLKAPEARALFAQDQAAFIIQGAWCISTWRSENPNLDFGVMALPVPDSGQKGRLPYLGAQPWIGISAGCAHPDVAAAYLEGLYSVDYQAGLVEDGGFVSAVKEVNETYMTDPAMKQYYELHKQQAALAPDPIAGNPETAQVYSRVTAVTPGLGEIAQGVLAESVDYGKELAELSRKTQKEWEDAIREAAGQGIPVSIGDFEFGNWNPLEPYTMDLYHSHK